MAPYLFVVLAVECTMIIAWGLLRRGRVYEFPVLAALVFAGWVLPQVPGLLNDGTLPLGSLEKALVMTILCLSMCAVGWAGAARVRHRRQPMSLDIRRLLWTSVVLSAVGAYFFHRLGQLPEEMTSAAQWTGLPVRYLFFAQVLYYGFAIGVVLWLRTGSRVALAVAIFGGAYFLRDIIFAGRRAVAIEFVILLATALWFQRRRIVPRLAVLGLAAAAALGGASIVEYRELTLSGQAITVQRVAQIDFAGNFVDLLAGGGDEFRNAAYAIEAVDRSGAYDYGLFHWNQLVFNYVPAQIVGRPFKDYWTVASADPAQAEFAFTSANGTTATGMADAFGSFGYFGCLKFLLIALVMGLFYQGAMRGSLVCQIWYGLSITSALHAVTHTTHWVVAQWIHMMLFLLPALVLCWRRHTDARATRIVGSEWGPARHGTISPTEPAFGPARARI